MKPPGSSRSFSGPPFNDGDDVKWLEELVQAYAITRDPNSPRRWTRYGWTIRANLEAVPAEVTLFPL